MQTIIYQSGGRHRGPTGTTYDYKGIDSEATLPDGWSWSLNEALNPPKKSKPKPRKVKSDELE